MSQQIFRKVSLERLASPEQLDQLMHVTDTRGWISLAAVGSVLVTALVWGLVGSIPERVSGQGMLIRTGGIFEVIPTAGGRVVDVSVDVGDVVTEGQVVARVEQPDLVDRLEAARATLANLRDQRGRTVAYTTRDARLQADYLRQQQGTLEQSIAASQKSMRVLEEKIAKQEQLVQEGLLTKSTLLNTQQQYQQAVEKVGDQRGQLTQIAAKELEQQNQEADHLNDADFRIAEAEDQVRQLERQLQASSEVVAPYTGRILELLTERGNIVQPGEALLTLDLAGKAIKDLEAVIYVPASYGKQLRPGMPIQIAPSTIKQEEYGLMLGKVTYVSDFPATPKGMQRVLKNNQLVTALSGGGAPYEVHADLMVDPSTVSRYRWSSSKGPPIKIESGTLALGNITVASKRPIEMVIPLVRKYTGI